MTLLLACILSGLFSVGLYLAIRGAVKAWWNRQPSPTEEEWQEYFERAQQRANMKGRKP